MTNDGKAGTPKRPYEIGKGKPPRHTQFKKGAKSANPAGRPRKLSPEELARRRLKELLEEMVTIREGERTMKVSAFEAYVRRLRSQALSTGSIRAGREWLELSIKFGSLLSRADTAEILPSDHRAIVARFLARTRGEEPPVESADPEASDASGGAGAKPPG